jgi:hypothetical protein
LPTIMISLNLSLFSVLVQFKNMCNPIHEVQIGRPAQAKSSRDPISTNEWVW